MTRADCKHQHLQFLQWGQELKCIDCAASWLLQNPSFEIRDYSYQSPDLHNQTRHSPWVSPKMAR